MQPEYRASAEETWDAIAESFDTTRQKPWKFCLDFIRSLKNTDVVADIGCGNGRHLFPCAENCSHAIRSRYFTEFAQNSSEETS